MRKKKRRLSKEQIQKSAFIELILSAIRTSHANIEAWQQKLQQHEQSLQKIQSSCRHIRGADQKCLICGKERVNAKRQTK